MIMLVIVVFIFLVFITLSVVWSNRLINPVSVALSPIFLGSLLLVLDPFGYGFHVVGGVTSMMLVVYGSCLMLPGLVYGYLARCSRHINNQVLFKSYSIEKVRRVAFFFLTMGITAYSIKVTSFLKEYNVPLNFWYAVEFVDNNLPLVEESLRTGGYSLMQYSGFLGVVYSAYIFAKSERRISIGNCFLLIVLFMYMASLAGLFIKVQLIIAVMLFFFAYAVLEGRYRWLIALTVVLAGVTVAFIDNYMYSGDTFTAKEFVVRYMAGSIVGLENYIQEGSVVQSFGARTFEPVYFVLERLGVETNYIFFNEFYVINDLGKTVNTGTIILGPYMDFGVMGVLIFGLIIGGLSWWVMAKCVKTQSLTCILCYSILLTALFMGFIGGIYKHIEFFFIVLVHLLLSTLGVFNSMGRRWSRRAT